MIDLSQELMTPHEAARWFRRSPSWLRQQTGLIRLGAAGGQPLYHVHSCRAYVLGRVCGLDPDQLRLLQLRALAAACGVEPLPAKLAAAGTLAPESSTTRAHAPHAPGDVFDATRMASRKLSDCS
jgi:hypothetical protein